MHENISGLAPLDASTVAMMSQFQMSDVGKRQWETSKAGYLKWAVNQLMARARGAGEDSSSVHEMRRNAEELGQAEDLKSAEEAARTHRDHDPVADVDMG